MKVTTAQLKNIATFVAIGIGILLIQALGGAVSDGKIPGFMDGQTFDGVRGEIGGLLTLLGTAGGLWMVQNRPRLGSERLAKDVDALREAGVSRQDMTVVTKEDAELLKTEAARIREFQQRLEEKRLAKAAGRG